MKLARALAALTLAVGLMFDPLAGQAATFTYRGSLQDAGKPAEGNYDLELTLYSAASGGRAIAGPLALYAVPVQGGAFAAQADFGPLAYVAGTIWLGVKVRSAGSRDFAELSARSPVSADATASVCPGAWTLDGNAGNVAGNYLGTADAQPLVVKTAGQTAMSLQPSAMHVVNGIGTRTGTTIVAGDPRNSVTAGIVGATVVGGGGSLLGEPPTGNTATDDFATVVGGIGNSATYLAAAVAGGQFNQAGGHASFVGGGAGNTANGGTGSAVVGGSTNQASSDYAFIGAGEDNVASGPDSAVVGGIGNAASGSHSITVGGVGNKAGASYSLAAGVNAHVRTPAEAANANGDTATFVWADNSANGASFASTGVNQFLIRAQGGVGINAPPIGNNIELSITASANGNDNANLFMRQASYNAGILLRAGSATSTANNDAAFSVDQYNGTTSNRVMTIAANGDFTVTADALKPLGGPWTSSSDARLKRDVRPLDGALDRVLQLRGVTFEYANPDRYMHPAGRHTGFIAQQVQQVFPDWIGSTPDGYLTVGPNGFEAMTVEALRDLRAEKDDEIATLQARLDDKDAAVAALQARLDDKDVAIVELRARFEAIEGRLTELVAAASR